MTQEQLISEFQAVENNFNTAVLSNSVEEIAKCVEPEWVLVDAHGGIIPLERFYHVVAEGLLSHTTMTKEVMRVKVYNEIAVVTGRGKNTGFYNGQPIQADEWVTDIYRKNNDRWLCVLTHLTPVQL